jgi:hypothetical protein
MPIQPPALSLILPKKGGEPSWRDLFPVDFPILQANEASTRFLLWHSNSSGKDGQGRFDHAATE